MDETRLCFECRVAAIGGADFEAALALRDRVLRAPLGRPSARLEYERDRRGVHFVAMNGADAVGVLALFPDGAGAAILRSLAVAPERRRRGVGAALCRFAERWASANGVRKIEAEARTAALEFYEACGYATTSEEYMAHDVPHRRVQKEIADR